MSFNIIRADISKMNTDAIVNAANNQLLAGGGVCGSIFSAAGEYSLQEACNKIGYCETGEAVITEGFNLKAKYIIHTVGPIYGQDPVNEEKQLYSCYENSLKLAKSKNLESIAFPIISSGIYGYPKTEAIKIATKAIKDFLEDNEMQIYLVVYDKKSFRISEKLFTDVKSYITENLVKKDYRIRPDFSIDKETCETDALCSEKLFPKNSSLKDLMNIKSETFSEMLFRLIDEKGMTDVEVYKRANIDRKLFSKIRKKEYTPKKTTVISLIISLKLNMNEAKALLQRAGYAFDNWSKFDIIIEYFIENNNYDIFEINETLFAFDQQLLS